jgi:hypothetical protein
MTMMEVVLSTMLNSERQSMVETISLLLLELSNMLKFLNLTKLRQKLYPEMLGLPRELSSLELLVEISEKKSSTPFACKPKIALLLLKFVELLVAESVETMARKD